MKVLKDNYNAENLKKESNYDSPYPRKLVCDSCQSELEYNKEDLEMGVFGCMHLKCPLCGEENMLEDNELNIDLTKDNVEFPTHFYHLSKETGAVDCCNNKYIKEFIDDAIKHFRKNKNDSYYFSATGNLFVAVFNHSDDGDYYVVVTNNYYDTYIPFENEDYEGYCNCNHENDDDRYPFMW